jgi:uncharacterized protein (TIGR02266 family)
MSKVDFTSAEKFVHPVVQKGFAMPQQKKRQHPRISTDALLDYSGSDVMLYHRIENISLGGICIQTANPEEVGTIVELTISFPALEEMVEVQGEVVWANHDTPKDMGIRFINLSPEARLVLARYIEQRKKSELSPSGSSSQG